MDITVFTEEVQISQVQLEEDFRPLRESEGRRARREKQSVSLTSTAELFQRGEEAMEKIPQEAAYGHTQCSCHRYRTTRRR